jgi:hypothetical protein
MSAQPPAAGPEARAKQIRWLAPLFYLLLFLIIFAGLFALYWVSTLPNHLGEQQTVVVGATQFSPDTDASLRVVVQNFSDASPIAGAAVSVSLKPAQGPFASTRAGLMRPAACRLASTCRPTPSGPPPSRRP